MVCCQLNSDRGVWQILSEWVRVYELRLVFTAFGANILPWNNLVLFFRMFRLLIKSHYAEHSVPHEVVTSEVFCLCYSVPWQLEGHWGDSGQFPHKHEQPISMACNLCIWDDAPLLCTNTKNNIKFPNTIWHICIDGKSNHKKAKHKSRIVHIRLQTKIMPIENH